MSGGRIKLDLDSILYGYGFLKMWVICWVLVNQVTNMDDFSKRLTCLISRTNARLTWQYQIMKDWQLIILLSNVGEGIIA